MIYRTFVRSFTLALMLALTVNWANAQDPKKGEELFKNNCAQCHSRDMKQDMTGPALAGVEERWAKFPKKELYDWIRNSSGVLADASYKSSSYAKGLYASYKNTVMNAFPQLTDDDINSLLVYINNMASSGCAEPPCVNPVAANGTVAVNDKKEDSSSSMVIWALAFVLVLATVLLARYINNLNRLAQKRLGEEPSEEKSFIQIILNPTVVRILVFALVILGAHVTVNNAIGLGRQQNYNPVQPIKFSHELHSGKNGIDCQYCHDGARRSKHAVIPATNTCMNCHTSIQKGPEYGTAEILKIYAASGFNPISTKTPEYGQYFKAEVPANARLDVYRKWLKEANKDNKVISDSEINAQLAAAKPMIGKPVNWVRIHNLPDHAYFNHAQHVTIGKVACQDCHGKVEEMAIVKQYAPLSMGWCINCHRQTKVKFDENGYYNAETKTHKMYEQYHNEVKSGKRNGVTVEEIGGLECQKCHY
jgi:mono/diheme cytochrome c family protein